jgi:hypothetical protein
MSKLPQPMLHVSIMVLGLLVARLQQYPDACLLALV